MMTKAETDLGGKTPQKANQNNTYCQAPAIQCYYLIFMQISFS